MEAAYQELTSAIRGAVNNWYAMLTATEAAALLLLFAMVLALLTLMAFALRPRAKKKDSEMSKKGAKRHLRKRQEREEVLRHAADGIGWRLEDLVEDGVLTRDQANWAFRMFAHGHMMWDLIPPYRRVCCHPDPDELKKEITARLEAGIYTPVNIPGEKPIQVYVRHVNLKVRRTKAA